MEEQSCTPSELTYNLLLMLSSRGGFYVAGSGYHASSLSSASDESLIIAGYGRVTVGTIMNNMLRGVVIPNEQAIRALFQTM